MLRLVAAVVLVAVLFAISPLAGGIALGLVGAGLVWIFLLAPSAQPNGRNMVKEYVDSLATKECPRCAETVKGAARVCRFCQFAFYGDDDHTPQGDLHRELKDVLGNTVEKN